MSIQLILQGAAGYEAENIMRLFFPAGRRAATADAQGDLVLALAGPHALLALVRMDGRTVWQAQAPAAHDTAEYDLCRLLYALLQSVTGRRPPWGMLTGVRPVRLIHDLRAEGAGEDAIRARFVDHYDCTPEKFQLAKDIADLQRLFLQANGRDCSVYIGIPFCPSRCSYCSFVSRAVGEKQVQALIGPYVDRLCAELTAIRQTVDACGLRVRTVYIGGGTPTSLDAARLEQLLRHIAAAFAVPALEEYTVEAGRPDCTDAEKLRLLKQYGATRISINPQTFSDTVLQTIGRRHTAQDVVDCYRAARAAGHACINMDLIAGLPGDTVAGFCQSLQTAIDLAPENITVHTLTLKRASDLVVEQRTALYDDVAAMTAAEMRLLPAAGYRPYYLYRQKGTLQNLENIGWCRPGHEGLYNIYMMEEVHTILAAGAGSCTKLVPPGARRGRIRRLYNCKYPQEYLARPDTAEKTQQETREFYAEQEHPQAPGQPGPDQPCRP